jgi:hypothetical protein
VIKTRHTYCHTSQLIFSEDDIEENRGERKEGERQREREEGEVSNHTKSLRRNSVLSILCIPTI